MMVIYIAGKFRGKNAWEIEKNIRLAEEAAHAVAMLGGAPLCPHTNSRFFHGTKIDGFWLQATLTLLRKCDAVYAIKNWQDSVGARGEVAEADRLSIPVFFEDIVSPSQGLDALKSFIESAESVSPAER